MAMDWANFLSAGTTGMAGGLKNLFSGNRKNPADLAGKHLDNMPPFIMELMKKYREQGDQASGPLMDQYQKLLKDPSSVLSDLGKGYKESPGYEWNKNQALDSVGNVAAAGGMLGSPQHQQNAMDTASGLASRDYNDYMKNALGLHEKGMGGLENFINRGHDTSENFSKMLQDYFNGKANQEFEGQASKNAGKDNMMKMLFDLFGKGASAAGLGM